MRQFFPFLLLPFVLTIGCSKDEQLARAAANPPDAAGSDSLTSLSDEFDNAGTLPKWRHAFKEEGWNANQLEAFDIGKSQPGWMMMKPYTSTWYRDYRGVLSYKPIDGDFVMTTRLHVSGRNGSGPPQAQFSLAGIMIRAPRTDSAQNWQQGRENYIFLSLGAADNPGNFQFEVKTTVNSDSQLRMSPAPSGDAIIQVARIGNDFILLKNIGGQWTVHQRYSRPDFPTRVQAGLTCYTDWPNASKMPPQEHNATVIRGGNPDLLAFYDYVRYRRPQVPASLKGKRLSDPGAVSDAELIGFLGDRAGSR